MVAIGGKKGKNSWISFVMKIKKEENLPSLKAAMTRASARKSEWKRGGGDVMDEQVEEMDEIETPAEEMEEEYEYVGGRKRARTARRTRGRSARRSRTARRSRSARRSRARGRSARRS